MKSFFSKEGKSFLLKLNAGLYGPELFAVVRREYPGLISSIRKNGDYNVLKLNIEDNGELFDFLNYLLYLKQDR